MARTGGGLLWKLAESDEVEIETRRDAKSALHRTTIWIVPTKDGVYVRSFKGKRGRWYQEATANPSVAVLVGRRKVKARAEHEKNPQAIREVSAAYKEKYGERWPNETEPMLKRSVLPTTLRLREVSSR
jgi:hypothetical protein